MRTKDLAIEIDETIRNLRWVNADRDQILDAITDLIDREMDERYLKQKK
jgi:hypothetical protein